MKDHLQLSTICLCFFINAVSLNEGEANASTLAEKTKLLQQVIEEDLKIVPSPLTNNICKLGAWNNVTTDVLPKRKENEKWKVECQSCVGTMMNDGQLRLISAFVYTDYIAVIHTLLGNTNYGRTMYCHYYDCNRQLIGTWESILYPVATVRCLRRTGAEFISLTLNATDKPAEPIPIVSRVNGPKYEVGVCMGELYGPQPRWMDVVEFIEHHKLVGISYFYLTIFNADNRTTSVIHDYERLGLLEPTWVDIEYKQVSWQFHMIQVADCFYRSRMHSKWTINIDHDERFFMKNPSSLSTLLSLFPKPVIGLSFQVSRILVNDDVLPHNVTYFETYNTSTRPLWAHFKSMYQHEHSHVPFFHWPWRNDAGYRVVALNNTFAYFRHYRYSSGNYWNGDWKEKGYGPFEVNKMNAEFATTLKSRIVEKLAYLFDKRHIRCEEIEPFFLAMFAKKDKCVYDNGTTINI